MLGSGPHNSYGGGSFSSQAVLHGAGGAYVGGAAGRRDERHSSGMLGPASSWGGGGSNGPSPGGSTAVSSYAMAPPSASANSMMLGVGGSSPSQQMTLPMITAHAQHLAQGVEPNPNLYVHNVPRDSSEEELRDLFGRFGTVERVRLKINPKIGPHAVYAFVTFTNTLQAQTALTTLQGADVRGRRLRVEYQRTPTKPNEDDGHLRSPSHARGGEDYEGSGRGSAWRCWDERDDARGAPPFKKGRYFGQSSPTEHGPAAKGVMGDHGPVSLLGQPAIGGEIQLNDDNDVQRVLDGLRKHAQARGKTQSLPLIDSLRLILVGTAAFGASAGVPAYLHAGIVNPTAWDEDVVAGYEADGFLTSLGVDTATGRQKFGIRLAGLLGYLQPDVFARRAPAESLPLSSAAARPQKRRTPSDYRSADAQMPGGLREFPSVAAPAEVHKPPFAQSPVMPSAGTNAPGLLSFGSAGQFATSAPQHLHGGSSLLGRVPQEGSRMDWQQQPQLGSVSMESVADETGAVFLPGQITHRIPVPEDTVAGLTEEKGGIAPGETPGGVAAVPGDENSAEDMMANLMKLPMSSSDEPIWRGSLTRSDKKRLNVSMFTLRGNIQDVITKEISTLNVSHRSPFDEMVRKNLTSIGILRPADPTQARLFGDYLSYFKSKNRAGVVKFAASTTSPFLYILPSSTAPFHAVLDGVKLQAAECLLVIASLPMSVTSAIAVDSAAGSNPAAEPSPPVGQLPAASQDASEPGEIWQPTDECSSQPSNVPPPPPPSGSQFQNPQPGPSASLSSSNLSVSASQFFQQPQTNPGVKSGNPGSITVDPESTEAEEGEAVEAAAAPLASQTGPGEAAFDNPLADETAEEANAVELIASEEGVGSTPRDDASAI